MMVHHDIVPDPLVFQFYFKLLRRKKKFRIDKIKD